MSKLTKEAIARLLQCEPRVKLVNGVFNVASVTAVFSRHSFELQVKVTHPLLVAYAGQAPQEVEFRRWEAFNGHQLDVPEELFPIVEKLKVSATMTNDVARAVHHDLTNVIRETQRELGLPQEMFLAPGDYQRVQRPRG